jgi:hypothetical protein
MLINFGDFIDGNTSITAKPFIQLLSITNDTAETHNDFVKVRLNGIDTTGDTNLLPAKVVASSPDSKRRTIYIIAGTVGGCLVLIAIAALLIGCFKRRNRYQRLGNPAPAAPTDMYMAAPTGQHAYRPGPVYDNPFEHQRR